MAIAKKEMRNEAALRPEPVAIAALPLAMPDTVRWSARRKASVVVAVRSGVISREVVHRDYLISPEEFAAWEAAFERHGTAGLRATRQQIYRRTEPREAKSR